MLILGIDPGPDNSGIALLDLETRRVVSADGAADNEALLRTLRYDRNWDAVAVECIEAMYAHVGRETVRTIRFTGRIEEAVEVRNLPLAMLSPQLVKKTVCGTAAAKDPAVRQALIDTLGPPGRKADPGPTYGVSKHAWRALAAALAASELGL